MKSWLVLALLVLLMVPATFAVTYTTIDFPGAVQTFANGINAAGDIVGSYQDSLGVQHGFIRSNGILSTIDPPTSAYTYATGINDSDQVIGYYSQSDGTRHGFVLTGQTYTDIDYPGATYTYPF